MALEFLEVREPPPKPVYEVVRFGQVVGELFWDEVGPMYWYATTEDITDLTATDLMAIAHRLRALTLQHGGNPDFEFDQVEF